MFKTNKLGKHQYNRVILVILVYSIYLLINPLGDGFHKLRDNVFELSQSEEKSTTRLAYLSVPPSLDNISFSHKGKNNKIIFNESLEIHLRCFLKATVKEGVKFQIFKNSEKLVTHIVFKGRVAKPVLSVKPGDYLQVYYDTKYTDEIDKLLFGIQIRNPVVHYSENLLAPLLWSIFLVFLYEKGFALLAGSSQLTFVLILLGETLNFGPVPLGIILRYTYLLFTITLIWVVSYQELQKYNKWKIITFTNVLIGIIIYAIPLFPLMYYLNYGVPISTDVIYAILQSNTSESFDYAIAYIDIKWLLLILTIMILFTLLMFKQGRIVTKKVSRTLLFCVILTLILTQYIEGIEMRIPTFFFDSYQQYQIELRKFKEVQQKRKRGETQFLASKKQEGETYVVVIGESLNKHHMGIYDYFRETTPKLAKYSDEELYVFQNAYSIHTHTMRVLSLALTEANQINKKAYYNSSSIIDVLNKANLETHWVTNQAIQGPLDNLVSVIAHEADYIVPLNHSIGGHYIHTIQQDGEVIEYVKSVLIQKSTKNRVIFVHLMGSHSRYAERYPTDDSCRIFKDYAGKAKLGNLKTGEQIVKNMNHYDNSVLYNDYVVSTLLGELTKSKGVTAFLYFSDHSEDVFNNFGHNSGNFTYTMTEIPLLISLSDGYKQRYPVTDSILKGNRSTLYSNDFIYNTLLGLIHIETERTDSSFDLCNGNFTLPENQAYTLKGEKLYTSPENNYWWSSKNARFLKRNNLIQKVYVNNVNTIGKLKEIWHKGYRSIRVNVLFDKGKLTLMNEDGATLENLLSSIRLSELKSVRIDCKNLNKTNLDAISERFSFLTNSNKLTRDIFILESNTSNLPSKKGCSISYILPELKISNLLIMNDSIAMKKLSIMIKKDIIDKEISNIQFHSSITSFVKNYLQSSKIPNLSFTLQSPISLTSENFINAITGIDQDFTIIASYKSIYDL
jgi:heptose-I-phosphate ethanolaminephosphotransferase